MDHLSYFGQASTVPWFVADRALRELRLPSSVDVVAVNDDLVGRASRRRALRAWLVLGATGLSAMAAVLEGGSRLDAITRGTLVFMALAVPGVCIMRLHERRDIKRTLAAARQTAREATHVTDRRARAWGQGLLLFATGLLFFTVGACIRQLGAGSGSAQFLAGWVVAGWAVVITCGYRPWRWLLVTFSLVTTVAAYGDVLASHPEAAGLHPLIVPGVAATVMAWVMTLALASGGEFLRRVRAAYRS